MKNKRFYSVVNFLLLCGAIIVSCKRDSYNIPSSTDKTKPLPPSNIRVLNFKGGAYIVYDLPKTENTLYVKADYVINDSTGASRQAKTSYYTDTTVVEGFAAAKSYPVTLKTVTRANIESDPVTVTVNPDTPAYVSVARNLKLEPTFGGINANTRNPSGQGITIVYLYDDPVQGKYVIREQKYFDALHINYAIRGFDTLPKRFGAYVTDRWGNKSAVTYATIKPVFEQLLDKSKFSPYDLPSDIPTQGGYPKNRIWDNVINNSNFWHSQFTPVLNPAPAKPYVISFGIGQLVRLSRFVLYQRQGFEYWGDGTFEIFSIWGSAADTPRDAVLPEYASEGALIGDWVNLGNFRFPNPPSGNAPSNLTTADRQWWEAGVNFEMPAGTPKVKFIRVAVSKTWGNREGTYLTEMTLYGGN